VDAGPICVMQSASHPLPSNISKLEVGISVILTAIHTISNIYLSFENVTGVRA